MTARKLIVFSGGIALVLLVAAVLFMVGSQRAQAFVSGEHINKCRVYPRLNDTGSPIPHLPSSSDCDDSDDGDDDDNGGEDDDNGGGDDNGGDDGDDNGDDNGDGDEGDGGEGNGNGGDDGSNDDTDTNTGNTGSNPTGGGGSVGGGGGVIPQVLGSATSSVPLGIACDQYLTKFIKPGAANDASQVYRLQALLQTFEGANVTLSGVYDAATVAAVHSFQTKYASEILAPWGIPQSTGFVYLTTRKKVNEIYCQNTQQFPLTEAEQQVIEKAKERRASAPRGAQPASAAASVTTKPEVEPEVVEIENLTPEPIVNTPARSFMDFFRGLFDRF